MPPKGVALDVPRTVVAVEIQTCFANGYHGGVCRKLGKLVPISPRDLRGVVGMDSYGGVYGLVLARNLDGLSARDNVSARAQNTTHAYALRARDDLRQVDVIFGEAKVCVRVEELSGAQFVLRWAKTYRE